MIQPHESLTFPSHKDKLSQDISLTTLMFFKWDINIVPSITLVLSKTSLVWFSFLLFGVWFFVVWGIFNPCSYIFNNYTKQLSLHRKQQNSKTKPVCKRLKVCKRLCETKISIFCFMMEIILILQLMIGKATSQVMKPDTLDKHQLLTE